MRDAGLSFHCVHACGSAGMRALGVWCDRACVWPLTPVCPPVCLSTPLFGHTWPRLESPTWPLGFYLFLVSFVLRSYIDSFDLCPCFSPCSLVCSLYFTVSLFHSFFLSCLEWWRKSSFISCVSFWALWIVSCDFGLHSIRFAWIAYASTLLQVYFQTCQWKILKLQHFRALGSDFNILIYIWHPRGVFIYEFSDPIWKLVSLHPCVSSMIGGYGGFKLPYTDIVQFWRSKV